MYNKSIVTVHGLMVFLSNYNLKETIKMTNDSIKASVLCNLKTGTIQPFQVEEHLKLKGLPAFEVKKLKPEILEAYRKDHPCY